MKTYLDKPWLYVTALKRAYRKYYRHPNVKSLNYYKNLRADFAEVYNNIPRIVFGSAAQPIMLIGIKISTHQSPLKILRGLYNYGNVINYSEQQLNQLAQDCQEVLETINNAYTIT